MVSVLAGGFLVVHGLITTAIGAGSIGASNPPAMTMPSWLSWWPVSLGRSWLLDATGLGSPGAVIGGLIWLVAGLALIGAGLGYLGIGPMRDQWHLLAAFGALLGLVALGLYFHPFYVGAVAINLVLIALVWGRLTTAA